MASELAPDSEWDDGSEPRVIDVHGMLIKASGEIDDGVGGTICLVPSENEGCECCEKYALVVDVLAVIDRAGLDPVRIAARELVELCKPVTMRIDIGRRSIIEAAEKLKALL